MNAAAATTNTTNEAAIKSADELASYVDASLASWRAAFESSSSASLSEDDDGGGRLKQQLAKTNTSSGRSAVAAPIFANNRTLVICNENDGRGYGGGGDGSELPARSPRQRLGCSTDGTKMRNDASKSDKIVLWKDSPADYRKRLATFHSETYFAKPLSLSPLVCAAFG
jgi:hypothetical protein